MDHLVLSSITFLLQCYLDVYQYKTRGKNLWIYSTYKIIKPQQGLTQQATQFKQNDKTNIIQITYLSLTWQVIFFWNWAATPDVNVVLMAILRASWSSALLCHCVPYDDSIPPTFIPSIHWKTLRQLGQFITLPSFGVKISLPISPW